MHEYDHPATERVDGLDHDRTTHSTAQQPAPSDAPQVGWDPPTVPTSAGPVHGAPHPAAEAPFTTPAPHAAQPAAGATVIPPPAPPAWGQPGPDGYPQYHQPAVPGYGPPVYGPPPVPVQQQPLPEGGGRGQRGLIIALAGVIAALLLGAGVAVIMVVAGRDKPTHAARASAATPPRTVTTVIRETTVRAKPTRSHRSADSSRSASSSRSTGSSRSISSSRASTATASSPSVARAAIKSMLQRHFANIRDGNYASAFGDLGASLGQSQSSWISDIKADGLYSFSLSVSPQITSSTSAVASINSFHTEADASGCKNWSGSWNVVKSGGRWVISKSNLSQTVVSCGE